MLVRRDHSGVLAIGQPAHAWVCGQLARAWGNQRFGAVTALDEVALGAEQHDVGMAQLDLDPPLDRETGLPRSFMDLPLEVHLSLWRAGPSQLVSQSRYAALLAAIHGRRLYELRDLDNTPVGEATRIRDFIDHSRAFEASLLGALRADPATASQAAPEVVARNSQLLWTWDLLSLALLLDWVPRTLPDVPTAAGGTIDVALSAVPDRHRTLSLDPWPFTQPSIQVRAEGRRLTRTFSGQDELSCALALAPWETIELALVARPDRT